MRNAEAPELAALRPPTTPRHGPRLNLNLGVAPAPPRLADAGGRGTIGAGAPERALSPGLAEGYPCGEELRRATLLQRAQQRCQHAPGVPSCDTADRGRQDKPEDDGAQPGEHGGRDAPADCGSGQAPGGMPAMLMGEVGQ